MSEQQKIKKPFYKKWWGILILIFVGIVILGNLLPDLSFNNGLEAYNKKDFIEAYDNFTKVKSNNENYAKAQNYIKELAPIVDSLKKNATTIELAKKNAEEKAKAEEQKSKQLQADQDKANKQIEERKEKIKKIFNSATGEPIKFAESIKKIMNDPDSFEHVSTDYKENSTGIYIEMTYRGKNGYGAKIIQIVKANLTIDGDLINIVPN